MMPRNKESGEYLMDFDSEQHFASYFTNRVLYRMRPTKGGSAVPIARISSLKTAMAEGGQVDDYLLGTDAADLLSDET